MMNGDDVEPEINIEQNPNNIFDKLGDIIQDDTALNFVTNRFDGVDNEQIRQVVGPLIGVLKQQGVEMFSAGDEIKAEALQKYVDSAGSYFGIFQAFWPALKALYDSFKTSKQKEQGLTDDEWNEMMYEETATGQQFYPQEEMQHGPIDPNFLSQAQNPNQPRYPQQQGNRQNYGTQPVQAKKESSGLTLQSMMKAHMARFGKDGMDTVVQEFETITGKSMDIEDNLYGYESDEPQSMSTNMPQQQQRRQRNDTDDDSFANLTFASMIEAHRNKFGSGNGEDAKGWSKVRDEVERYGRATGVEINVNLPDGPVNNQGPAQQYSQQQYSNNKNLPVPMNDDNNDSLYGDDDLTLDMDELDMEDSFDRSSEPIKMEAPRTLPRKNFNDMPGTHGFNRDEEFI